MADPVSPSDTFTFESNKIVGPPNANKTRHVSSFTEPTLFGNGSHSFKFSLNIRSPKKSKNINGASYLEPKFGDDLITTPKTRGISLLKKTSSQYTNHEFTKRLSIPSFHVADQILMDLLNEQNNTQMNTIDEDKIDDEDNDDLFLFMDGDGDDSNDEDDDDLDSIMTLNAFPDLPEITLSLTNNTSKASLPLSQSLSASANTPSALTDVDDENYDDYDDDVFTPATFQKMFNSFHKTKDDNNSQNEKGLSMKINVSQFKDEDEDEDENEKEYSGYSGFSVLQHSTSMRFVDKIRKSTSGYFSDEDGDQYEDESMTIINNDSDKVKKKKKLSAADSAILVAKELMDTEILYQNHLINLIDILLGPIVSTYFGNDCISSIFYKFLSEIISVSKSFTMRLSIYVRALQIPQLANWIYFICKRFSIYAHYAKMYDIFLDRLSLCKAIDDNIEFWIKRQEKKFKIELKNQKLHSLLMMPVQRLPRYILLLEELIKYTHRIDDVGDVGTILFLQLAKSEIQTVSQRVNEMVRQRENRSNLRELSNRFCGANKSALLRSNRVLVYEGFLYKVRKYKIKYYFHLFSDILTYSNINNNGLFNIHRIIDLNKIDIIDLPNIDKRKRKTKNKIKIWYRFLLKSQQKSFEILTENQQEKQNWLLLIEAAISRLSNICTVSSPQSQISQTSQVSQYDDDEEEDDDEEDADVDVDDTEYYAPYWVPDDASNNCCCCNNEFTVLNRKHHCRSCGNLVCKSCSKHKKLLTNIDKKKPVKICNLCHTNNNQKNKNKNKNSNTPLISSDNDDVTPMSPNDSNDNVTVTPKGILAFIRQYKNKLRILLEHLCRPIMDVVENNKIITDYITSKRFYNKSNIILKEEQKQENQNENKNKNKELKMKKNKKKQLRKKNRKRALQKNGSSCLNASDVGAKIILNNLYKYGCYYKKLISLFTILEQIYGILCSLHEELSLIIFKKHINYEDDMILDYFNINSRSADADSADSCARIGRLFIMYTDLFSIHVEYACRYPECADIIIYPSYQKENYLTDFIRNVDSKLGALRYELSDLLQAPLQFTRDIHGYLSQMGESIDWSMVNSSDLDLCIKTLSQIVRDLDKERLASQQRIKLYKLESQFDFEIDFRERGRTLVMSDFVILYHDTANYKKTKHNYYFHLFSNILCYSSKKLGNNKFVLKKCIHLSNMYVIDGSLSTKKKNKKRDLRTLTIKYYENFQFDEKKINIISENDENDCNELSNCKKEQIKIFSLVFACKEKKMTWFALLKNLMEEEKSKYAMKKDKNCNSKHVRSYSSGSGSMKRYSATVGKKYAFCGICHYSFNRLFNVEYKCIKCDLPLCGACSIDKFYLSKQIIAPKHLKLCVRCNYYNQNERSCNILCV